MNSKDNQWTEDVFCGIKILVCQIIHQNLYNIDFLNLNNIFQTNNLLETAKSLGMPIDSFRSNTKGINAISADPNKGSEIYIETFNQSVPSVIELLIHEITHAYDDNKFATTFTNGDLSIINNHELCDAFFNYSEFHAYSYATLYTPYIMDALSQENRHDIAFSQTVSHLRNKFNNLISSETKDWTAYDIFQWLGELFVIDKYYWYDIEHSCAKTYLYQIFDSQDFANNLLSIYNLCIQLLFENNIAESLKELNHLMGTMSL